MKKKFYILLLAMVVSFAATAQRFEYQLGLKGGLGMGWVGNVKDDITQKDKGLCYKYGLTAIYYFGESYGITSGFNIIGNNVSYKYKLIDESEESPLEQEFKLEYKNTYCQVPLLLKMRTDAFASRLRVFGEIGYGLNILVDGIHKLNDTKQEITYRDVCSSFIVHIGLDVEVLNHSTLQFIVSYDDFFSNMLAPDNKLTLSNLCFELGFLF